MAWWKKREPADAENKPSPELVARVRARAEELTRPCVRIAAGGPATDPTASFVGGHPYLPAAEAWPVIDEEPAAFVCQVNFAQVPPLPGFPTNGLLQWFCGADDVLGLTFDETSGAEGFVLRWYDDLSAPSVADPSAPVPKGEDHYPPTEVESATAMVFTMGRSLGLWDSLPDEVRSESLWQEWAEATGQPYPEIAFDFELTGKGGPMAGTGSGSKLGGHPTFTQTDPRGDDAFAAADTPAGRLLIELDSEEFGGWGDGGIGHLFGDPEALGRGDLSAVRYHWDCG